MTDKQVLLLMLGKAKATFGVREYPGEEEPGLSGIEFRTRAGEFVLDFYFDASGNLTMVYEKGND
jgi:hypothetical protein